MIRLALRIALAGGRGRGRMVLTAVAVAVGVILALGAFALPGAHHRADLRRTTLSGMTAGTLAAAAPGTALRWRYDGQTVQGGDRAAVFIVDAASEGPGAPDLPGGVPVPSPGTMRVSAALERALRGTGVHENVRARLPLPVVGLLPRALVPRPTDLVAVIGRPTSRLPADAVSRVTGWDPVDPSTVTGGYVSFPDRAVRTLTPVVILAPIVILVGAAARIGRRRRDVQLAALRLVGASTRQLAVLAAAESLCAAIAGALAGGGLFALVTRTAATVRLPSETLYAADLVPPTWAVATALLGFPLVAAAAALVSVGRALTRPLAVRRAAAPSRPGAVRALPLVAGWAGLVACHRMSVGRGLDLLLMAGGTLMTVGVVLAGPWLVRVAARAVVRAGGGRPGLLLGGRRLLADAAGGFRTVTGVAAAAFILTSAAVWFAAIDEVHRREVELRVPAPARGVTALTLTDTADRDTARRIVRREAPTAIEVRAFPIAGGPEAAVVDCPSPGPVVVPCDAVWASAEGRRYVGRTVALQGGVGVVRVRVDDARAMPELVGALLGDGVGRPALVLPAARVPGDPPPMTVRFVVPRDRLDAVSGALLAEGVLAQAWLADTVYSEAMTAIERGLAGVVLLAFTLGAVGLAAGGVDGLLDRRAELARLQATGVSRGVLREATAVEHVAPLVVAVAAAMLAGLVAGATFVLLPPGSAGGYPSLVVPWGRLALIGGLAVGAGLAVLAVTLPTLGRAIRPGALRAE